MEAAKASIPFGRLGRSPQSLVVPGSGICSSGTTEVRFVAHRSESHRLSYIDASRRASSVISRANLQPAKPLVLTCLPVLILALSLGFSMPSRAKETPPKTLLFPIALALLTLPPLCLLSSLTSISSDTPFLAQS